jgi:hypothetical protein
VLRELGDDFFDVVCFVAMGNEDGVSGSDDNDVTYSE